MALFNQHWIGMDGKPVTGRVPTQMFVVNDQKLTAQQQGAVFHTYKLFCDAVQFSANPGGYHVQHQTLSDGTVLRMESNMGVHRVYVRPVGGADEQATLTGFLFVPGDNVWRPDGVGDADTWTPWNTGFWSAAMNYGSKGQFVRKYLAEVDPALSPPSWTATSPAWASPLEKCRGACYWHGGRTWHNVTLNWRGAPRKYMPFEAYTSPQGYVATSMFEYLHTPSNTLWVQGNSKQTDVPFILSACLFRPEGAKSATAAAVRVFGSSSVGSGDFRVFDLAPEGIELQNCTLGSVIRARKFVTKKTYAPADGYSPGNFWQRFDIDVNNPMTVGSWRFAWVPVFNESGDKLAAGIEEVVGETRSSYVVCQMDPTTFLATDKHFSTGRQVSEQTYQYTPATSYDDGDTDAILENGVVVVRHAIKIATSEGTYSQNEKIYVACDYDESGFVTMWQERSITASDSSYFSAVDWAQTSSFTSDRTESLNHSRYGVLETVGISTGGSDVLVPDYHTVVRPAVLTTGHDVTADLAAGLVHLLFVAAYTPSMTSTLSPVYGPQAAVTTDVQTQTITSKTAVWFKGVKVALSEQTEGFTVTYSILPGSSYFDGFYGYFRVATEVIANVNDYSARYSPDPRYAGYGCCTVTKDGKRAYIGRGPTHWGWGKKRPPPANEGIFLKAGPKADELAVWPAPAWWDGKREESQSFHANPVFIE